MKLVGAMIGRDEAGPSRYLRAALQNMRQWCEMIVFLDDNSEDDTADVAREEGAFVVIREGADPMWGAESQARQELWNLAAEPAKDFGAWVLFQDADMLLSADPRPLLATTDLNSWLWRLYDVWDERTTYRADGFWRGHTVPRPWLVCPSRVPDGWQPVWSERGLHCGHLPLNWPLKAAVAPEQYFFEHLSFMTPEHRVRKHAQYLSRRDQLRPEEIAHAESILDGE